MAPYKYKSESGLGGEYDSPVAKLKFKAEWRRWRAAAVALADEPRPPISPLQKRIDWLAEVCALNPSQQFLLGLFARIARVPHVGNLVGAVNRNDYSSEQFDFSELRPVLDTLVDRRDLSENGLLTRFGLIEKDDNDNFQISDLVGAILSRKQLDRRKSGRFFSGSRRSLRSSWDDFAHLGELRDLAARIVAPRATTSPNAANILIYGPPGTGKSEFVKTLAARLGLSAHFVGERNGQEAEPNRRERIAALMIANALGATGGR